MKLGHFTIKDLDEFHEKDENDELDKTLQTTHIKPSKSMGFMKLTIYMKLNTQMKHKMKMSLMDEIKFMMSMQSNSLCTKVITWMKFDEIDVLDKN
jgi:phosphoenolpyruvate carboxylase